MWRAQRWPASAATITFDIGNYGNDDNNCNDDDNSDNDYNNTITPNIRNHCGSKHS